MKAICSILILFFLLGCVSIDDGGSYEPEEISLKDFEPYFADNTASAEQLPPDSDGQTEQLVLDEPDEACAAAKEKTKVLPRQIEIVLTKNTGRAASLTNIIDDLEAVRAACYQCPAGQNLYLAGCEDDPHKALADIITAMRVLQSSPSKNINDVPRFTQALETAFANMRACRSICE